MEKNYTLVVPFYNESGSICPFLENISDYLSRERVNHIILSNDASTDLSPKKRHEILKIDPRIKIIDLPKRQGQSRAILAGIKAAQTENIITMDGNGRQSLEYIPELIKRFEKGKVDMALCVRTNKSQVSGNHMVFISTIANRLINKLFKTNFKDMSCTYKVFKKDLVEAIPEKYVWPGLHRYLPLVAVFQGKKVAEVLDINVSKRKYGRSKYSVWKYLETFRDLYCLIKLKKHFTSH